MPHSSTALPVSSTTSATLTLIDKSVSSLFSSVPYRVPQAHNVADPPQSERRTVLWHLAPYLCLQHGSSSLSRSVYSSGYFPTSTPLRECHVITFLRLNSCLINRCSFYVGTFGVFPLHALYPLMKRVTMWPQAWLGLAMNWGLPTAWLITSPADVKSSPMWALTFGAFWFVSILSSASIHISNADSSAGPFYMIPSTLARIAKTMSRLA